MVRCVVLQETNAALNSVWGGQRENKVTPRRGHYQVYGPQTIILLKELKWVWNSARKTVKGCNVGSIVCLFVLNERRLYLGGRAKNGESDPSSTKM